MELQSNQLKKFVKTPLFFGIAFLFIVSVVVLFNFGMLDFRLVLE